MAIEPTKPSARPIAAAVPIALDPDPASASGQLIALDSPASKQREVGKVSFDVSARINGADVGRVSLLIRDEANISVRLSDLLTLLQAKIEPGLYERLSGASAAQNYITFNELRAAGIAVRFDDRDQLLIAVR